jgi:hypothetical protein
MEYIFDGNESIDMFTFKKLGEHGGDGIIKHILFTNISINLPVNSLPVLVRNRHVETLTFSNNSFVITYDHIKNIDVDEIIFKLEKFERLLTTNPSLQKMDQTLLSFIYYLRTHRKSNVYVPAKIIDMFIKPNFKKPRSIRGKLSSLSARDIVQKHYTDPEMPLRESISTKLLKVSRNTGLNTRSIMSVSKTLRKTNCDSYLAYARWAYITGYLFPGKLSPIFPTIYLDNSKPDYIIFEYFIELQKSYVGKKQKSYVYIDFEDKDGGHVAFLEIDHGNKVFAIIDTNRNTVGEHENINNHIISPIRSTLGDYKFEYRVAYNESNSVNVMCSIDNFGLCATISPYALLQKFVNENLNLDASGDIEMIESDDDSGEIEMIESDDEDVQMFSLYNIFQSERAGYIETQHGLDIMEDKIYSSISNDPNREIASKDMHLRIKNFFENQEFDIYEWLFVHYFGVCFEIYISDVILKKYEIEYEPYINAFVSQYNDDRINWVRNNSDKLKKLIVGETEEGMKHPFYSKIDTFYRDMNNLNMGVRKLMTNDVIIASNNYMMKSFPPE